MKRILDDENDGEDASVDIEGVTRDIGKLREEEANSNGTGRGWDTDLEFTAKSIDLSQSPRLKTNVIPSRIEQIMEDERSFAEDDDEEEEDEDADVVKVQERPARRGLSKKSEAQKVSQVQKDENEIKETTRGRSQERRDRLRRDLRERREERRPITSYESESNRIPQEREGALRNRVRTERKSQSNDFSRNDPDNVDLPLRNNKENVMPQEEKPLSRLEKRFQKEDGLKAIQRARENRLRNDYNHRVQEKTRPRSLEPQVYGETEEMHEKTILEEEGERIHGTPITIFSGNERRSNGPNSKQEDSLQILRNLSKAITSTNGSGRSSPGRSDNDMEARMMLSERSPYELEHVSERIPTNPQPPTPPPSAPIDPLLLPTPRVTGAFIETPAPPRMRTNTQQPKEESQIKNEPSSGSQSEPSKSSQSHSRTRPTPINSAPTVSAAADLQRIEKEARVDDSTTIDRDFSLLIKNQPAFVETENLEINLDFDENGQPLSPKTKARKLEQLAFNRMTQSLRHTTSSIRDARHGIERLEQQVASSKSHPHYNNPSPKELGIPTPKMLSTPIFLDTPPDLTINPNIHYLLIPLPRLRNPRTGKFTVFGLIFTIFMTWFITEWTMCEIYCHPKYSNKDVWTPSDPFWPWAIPTKIDHWTGKVVSGVIRDAGDWWEGYGYGYGEKERLAWLEKVRREKVESMMTEGFRDDEVMVDSAEKIDNGGDGGGGVASVGGGGGGGYNWWGSWDSDEVVG